MDEKVLEAIALINSEVYKIADVEDVKTLKRIRDELGHINGKISNEINDIVYKDRQRDQEAGL